MSINYKQINSEVMIDTLCRCAEPEKESPALYAQPKNRPAPIQKLIDEKNLSIRNQYVVYETDPVHVERADSVSTRYLVSGKRTFEAAKEYKGKKTAVLNFANNHSVGGAPFSAGAQEESLCRCSTLLPCLEACRKDFYEKHIKDYESGSLSFMGNDDLIYTPGVVVFKNDERTDPIIPKMLDENYWFKVNVITCAAPFLKFNRAPEDYEAIIKKRVKRILDVAAKEGNEVLILGKWGCGDYKNDEIVVSRAFCSLLPGYSFETVEFALGSESGISSSPFYAAVEELKKDDNDGIDKQSKININILEAREFAKLFGVNFSQEEAAAAEAGAEKYIGCEQRFEELLSEINRTGTDNLLSELRRMNFFGAPASCVHHNNFSHGLLYHSLEVYDLALEIRREMLDEDPGLAVELNEESVAIAALLHDVCKADEYAIDMEGKAISRHPDFPIGGHGDKSVIRILMTGYQLKPEEILAIKWHMGEKRLKDKEDIANCQKAKENALCRLIIRADYEATHRGESNVPKSCTFAAASPDLITELADNQVFVFGSNLRGEHSWGAASDAYKKFGAVWGQGVGMQGHSYAIPTMQGPASSIKPYVDDFIKFASDHPDLEFLVTRIGCGIAHRAENEMAPLFKAAAGHKNIRLPQSFIDCLTNKTY